MQARQTESRLHVDDRAHRIARWAVGLVALGAFIALGAVVGGGRITGLDRAVQAWILAHQRPSLVQLFRGVTTGGGITAMWIIALIGVVLLWFRARSLRVATILISPALTNGLVDSVKRIYARPRPDAVSMAVNHTYSFPSAHATTSAAVCCTLAFVLWREGVIGAHAAVALAVVPPLLVGVSRLYLNMHWASDVIGGWCAGVFVAALVSLLYTIEVSTG
jgi:undecaprenyl-diphosphatase